MATFNPSIHSTIHPSVSYPTIHQSIHPPLGHILTRSNYPSIIHPHILRFVNPPIYHPSICPFTHPQTRHPSIHLSIIDSFNYSFIYRSRYSSIIHLQNVDFRMYHALYKHLFLLNRELSRACCTVTY